MAYTSTAVIGPCLQSYLFGGYHLAFNINLTNLSETNSLPVWVVEYFIFISGLWFLGACMFNGILYFISFSSYITAQLKLITHYITQLNLHDHHKFRYDLKKIVGLHLDVLR